MPSARTTAYVLGSRDAVGAAGKELDWEVSFGHHRFLEETEKPDVRTKESSESTDDAFAVTLCKRVLEESSRGHSNGNTYKERLLYVGYLEKDGNFIFLYQR